MGEMKKIHVLLIPLLASLAACAAVQFNNPPNSFTEAYSMKLSDYKAPEEDFTEAYPMELPQVQFGNSVWTSKFENTPPTQMYSSASGTTRAHYTSGESHWWNPAHHKNARLEAAAAAAAKEGMKKVLSDGSGSEPAPQHVHYHDHHGHSEDMMKILSDGSEVQEDF